MRLKLTPTTLKQLCKFPYCGNEDCRHLKYRQPDQDWTWMCPAFEDLRSIIEEFVYDKQKAVLVLPDWPEECSLKLAMAQSTAKYYYKRERNVLPERYNKWGYWAILMDGSKNVQMPIPYPAEKKTKTTSRKRRWRRKYKATKIC